MQFFIYYILDFTQGMVCHETYKDINNNWLNPDEVFTEDGKKFFKKNNKSEVVKRGPSESMSKSKKNTIDPEEMIKNYGADSVRLFIMSDSPPEKDVQWSTEGMEGSYKFIQKLWGLHIKIIDKIKINDKKTDNKNINNFTNSLIEKISNNIENFRYNVIIANFHEMYNFFSKELNFASNSGTLIENYSKILLMLNPFIPHFSSECLSELSKYKKIERRKREVLELEKNTNEDTIMKLIEENKKLENNIKDKKIIKKILVPNKIINLIIK